jgi:hypothetical protein
MTDVKRERRSGQRIATRVPVSIKSQKGTVEATGTAEISVWPPVSEVSKSSPKSPADIAF